jgi:hypothetical protein
MAIAALLVIVATSYRQPSSVSNGGGVQGGDGQPGRRAGLVAGASLVVTTR